jgi:hypothetical protein
MAQTSKGGQLLGLWNSPEGIVQFTDDTTVMGGQAFRYTADGNTITLFGTERSLNIAYRIQGDVLTCSANGEASTARRIPAQAVADLVRSIRRGAGVWVGSESMISGSQLLNWTQTLVLYPDGSVDHADGNGGVQPSAYGPQFFSTHEGPPRQRAGRWTGDGTSFRVQWNDGRVWQGRIDMRDGQLRFARIGQLNEGSDVLFQRQPFPFLVDACESTAAADSPRAGEPQPEDNVAKLSRLMREMETTGRIDPSFADVMREVASHPEQLMALIQSDPERAETVLQQLKATAAAGGSDDQPLNSDDYYRDGPSKYELRWPLDPSMKLPVPFDRLDREMQFSVLFGEWTRRDMQGRAALIGGQVDGAEQIFRECLERARQLEVGELEARSYEGLMKVEQKRGNRQAEQKWLRAAQAARSA